MIKIFNPFNKKIEELEYSDLEKLIAEKVAEGWAVEYKQEFLSNSKIAKSIASFANSEGGWYIIGIGEDGHNGASEIKGIDLNEINNPVNKLNNAIKDGIRPIPFFKTNLIKCHNNKCVLVVYVEKGHDVPYFTNDGRIYQRVGESSDPHVLKDRYLFEQLLNRRKEFDLNFNSFAENKWGAPIEQSGRGHPYLEFYVYLDNQDKLLSDKFFSEAFFEEVTENFEVGVPLFDSDEFISPVIHFDNHYTSINSHILRYIDDNFQKSVNIGIILELFMKGHFKFILPFSTFDIYNLDYGLYENLVMYESILSDEEKEMLIFINLAESLWSFTIILEQYKRLLIKYDMDYDMYVLINFKNIWRTTLFLDDNEFINFIYKNKLPINLKSEVSLPVNGNYIKLNLDDFDSFNFSLKIASVLGFPIQLIESFSRCFNNYLTSKKDSVNEEEL